MNHSLIKENTFFSFSCQVFSEFDLTPRIAGDTEENVTLDHYTNVTIYQSEKAVGRRKTTQE